MSEQTYLNEDGTARLSRLVQYFESSDQSTLEARNLSERDRDYYDNVDDSQWTDAEKATLKKRRQPITTSNRIKPKVNFLLGVEAQRRSLPKAYPRTPKDEGSASAATDALRFIIDDNRYERTRSEVFKNFVIEGYGGVDIAAEQTAAGDIKIRITQIAWDRLFCDEHSRKSDFGDAKFRGQVIWMDLADARDKYPGAGAIFDASFTAESGMSQSYEDTPRTRWTDGKRKRIRIVEIWHLDGDKYHYCVYTKGGIIEEMESPYVDEEGESMPGIVLDSCFVDRDGNRYGVVRDWISIQDEINKRRSKALHLLSVRQTKGEKGAVDDVRKMKAELARADGHVEVNPGLEFDVISTGDMASAQFQLLNEAKTEIDSLGVNAQMAGSDSRNMSGRALEQRRESGLSELGPVFDQLKQFDHSVYRAIWCMVKQFWTAEKWIRVTDDERNVRFVGLNTPMTLGQQLLGEAQQQGMQVTPDMQHQAKNDPRMQQVVGKQNDVSAMDVDIVIDDAPSSASLQSEQFTQLADLAKVPGMNIPPRAIIEASDLRNKDKILKEMGVDGPSAESQQAQQKIQMLEETVKELGEKYNEAVDSKKVETDKLLLDRYRAETERLKLIYPTMPQQLAQVIAQGFGLDLIAEQHQENVQEGASGTATAQMPGEGPQAMAAPPPEPPPEPEPVQEQPANAGFFTPDESQGMQPDMQPMQ